MTVLSQVLEFATDRLNISARGQSRLVSEVLDLIRSGGPCEPEVFVPVTPGFAR
jgi:hypothetical protein